MLTFFHENGVQHEGDGRLFISIYTNIFAGGLGKNTRRIKMCYNPKCYITNTFGILEYVAHTSS